MRLNQKGNEVLAFPSLRSSGWLGYPMVDRLGIGLAEFVVPAGVKFQLANYEACYFRRETLVLDRLAFGLRS